MCIRDRTTMVNYNSSSSRYTSTVSQISYSGFTVLDSTVFLYDGRAKVIESDLYLGIPLLGGYDLAVKFKYVYAANGNISQYDIYDLTSGTEEHLSLIHISEPTRLLSISYAVFCLK